MSDRDHGGIPRSRHGTRLARVDERGSPATLLRLKRTARADDTRANDNYLPGLSDRCLGVMTRHWSGSNGS